MQRCVRSGAGARRAIERSTSEGNGRNRAIGGPGVGGRIARRRWRNGWGSGGSSWALAQQSEVGKRSEWSQLKWLSLSLNGVRGAQSQSQCKAARNRLSLAHNQKQQTRCPVVCEDAKIARKAALCTFGSTSLE
jgi:hypothetical protein